MQSGSKLDEFLRYPLANEPSSDALPTPGPPEPEARPFLIYHASFIQILGS